MITQLLSPLLPVRLVSKDPIPQQVALRSSSDSSLSKPISNKNVDTIVSDGNASEKIKDTSTHAEEALKTHDETINLKSDSDFDSKETTTNEHD